MKKTLLLIFAWILLLEVSLQLTALGVQWWMGREQKIIHHKTAHFKIVCLGESTTAWGGEFSYPSLLQKKLDSLYGRDFYQVINKGIAGGSTQSILQELPGVLDKEKPDLVIAMLGVNNYWRIVDNKAAFWVSSLEKLSEYSRMAKMLRSVLVNIEYDTKSDPGIPREKVREDQLTVDASHYWMNATYKVHLQKIIAEMQLRNISVIVMQYPRLPIEPIKEILINHQGVTFLENKNNFDEALKKKKFEELFYDHFAKVSGHLTPLGADLLADNVMSEIKKMETQADPGSINK